MTIQRGFNAGQFAVELDSELAGWVQSAEGGMPSADVVSEKVGPNRIAQKHCGPIKYDEISVKCGTGMSRGFYTWVKRTLDNDFLRQDGAIITANYNYEEVSRLNFHAALITEFGMPALDASSKDAATMSIKFSPEYTRRVKGAGDKITGHAFPTNAAKQKLWLPSNFRVDIDGLDPATRRIAKVEALTVTQKLTEVPIAGNRTNYREPASLEYSNVVLTLPEIDADPFYDWFDDFVINGNCSSESEKTGHVEYLSPDLKTVLFRINLGGLGIFKITPDKGEAGANGIRRVKVEMYCEHFGFNLEGNKSTWA